MTVPSEPVLASLALLTAALGFLAVRGLRRYVASRVSVQLWWSLGLALATAAMVVETIVYGGIDNGPLLQTYFFLSAALVGVLSIGAIRVFHRPKLEPRYAMFVFLACVVLGVYCFTTPLSTDLVVGGIIVGNPPLLLFVLSTVVTGPATVVLLISAGSSLRKTRDWRSLMLIAGALVLGVGGALYTARFPVALYYAEFIGIILLFGGLVSLRPSLPAAPAPAASAA